MKNPYTEPTLALAWRRGYVANAKSGPRDPAPPKAFAAEINRLGDGDKDTPSAVEAWEAYDAGVAAANLDFPI